MGTEFKFSEGTIYFDDIAVPVKDVEITDDGTATYADDLKHITIDSNYTATFTATCKIGFCSLVKLIGFWNAVKYKFKTLIKK